MAPLFGYPMDISHIGHWNLEVHHMYNFQTGVLERGDGRTVDFSSANRIVSVLMGTGKRRTVQCNLCSGPAREVDLLTPTALATAPDGSVYVGDYNLIRRVDPTGIVSTILQLR